MRLPLAVLSVFFLLTPSAQAADLAIAPIPAHSNNPSSTDLGRTYTTVTRHPGLSAYSFSARWADLEDETSPQLRDLTSLAAYGQRSSLPAFLEIQTILTTERAVPAKFAKTRWNKTELLLDIDTLMTRIATLTGDQVRWISLGSDADLYFEKHPGEFENYVAFYKKAAVSIRRIFPNVKIGIGVSHDGLRGSRKDIAMKLIEISDAAFISYLPVTPDYSVSPLPEIQSQLENLLALPLNKPFIFQSFGFPASTRSGSSQDEQAAFYETVFPVARNAAAVAFINLSSLHDPSATSCKEMQKMRDFKNSDFAAAACSTGFFSHDGSEKKSWNIIERLLSPAPAQNTK